MAVRFRNVDASPADDVRSWPYEALIAALDRAGRQHRVPVIVSGATTRNSMTETSVAADLIAGPGGRVRGGTVPRMGSTRYVALVRGINVGGRNAVAMADLRAVLSSSLDAVETYIQSGNVLFDTEAPRATLEPLLEATIEEAFGIPTIVVVRSHRQLRAVVTNAPAGFGTAPDTYHSDVVFLKAPLTAAQAMRVVVQREGVDQAWPGTGVVYFARLSARRTQSRMNRIMGTPEYRRMTIRSWSTTTRLLELLDHRASG